MQLVCLFTRLIEAKCDKLSDSTEYLTNCGDLSSETKLSLGTYFL